MTFMTLSDNLSFLVRNLADVPGDDGWLGPGEREVLAGLRFPKRRGDWRLGRWTAKLLLRDRLDLPADADLACIEIFAASDGAPEAFLRNAPAGVTLSISHAGGRSFCCAAPAGVALGCDIEQLAPRGEAMIADFFTPEETARVRSAGEENQILMANLIWSAKESVLKALREGLRRDTRSVVIETVSFDQDEKGEKDEKDGWRRFRGRCLQSARVFRGRWRASDRFVQTCVCDDESLRLT